MRKLTIFLAFLLFVGFSAQAQMQISGKVTGAEDGLSIPGVSVVVKNNTTIGTTTDIEGKYSLSVPGNAEVLVFSFVGMKTQEVFINARSVIDIQMEAEVLQMDEVVVTAIGIKREKREITYQTQKVVSEDLTKVAPTRAASALAGKVAGLQINVQDNGVNPNSQILLRGVRSISANNEALIVIDGSIASSGAFDDLNPNDIADLSVLKGATAAALYGAQAGNGALIVTTKSGKGADKFTIGLNSSYTIDKVSMMPDFQSEYGPGQGGVYDPIENTNWGDRFDGTMRIIGPDFPDDYPVADQYLAYAPIEDNLLNFFENGNSLQNTIYITGKTEDSQYYLSFGDQRSDGIVPNDTYQRNTLRINASKKIGKLEVGANVSYMKDKTDVVGQTVGEQNRAFYWFLLNTPYNYPLTEYSDWSDPLSYGYYENYANGYYENPYLGIAGNRNIDFTNRINGNVNLSYDMWEWLNFTGRVSMNNTWGTGKNWRKAYVYELGFITGGNDVASFVEESNFSSETYTGDALLTGNFSFMDNFTLKAILGGTAYSYKYKEGAYRANNLSIPDFYDLSNGTGSLQPALNLYSSYIDESQKRSYGFFGDFTVGYNNYLFLNFSGRNDWTSTLAKENRSYFYPAVGLSFVATDAFEVLKTGDILTFAKVTASNSTVYNDVSAYSINERFSQQGGFPYGSTNAFVLSNTAVDENISKEKLNTTEVGLNLGFFNGRVFVDFAWYRTITQDLITYTTPSYTSGSASYLTNIGELEGSGIELSLGGKVINARDFKWDLNINYSSSETIVNEIKEGLDEVEVYGDASGAFGVYAIKGEAFPQMKATAYERDPQGRIVVDATSGRPIMAEGLKALGKTTPDYILGLNSVISYKGFSISGTIDYRTGHVYYEEGSDAMEFTGRSVASIAANRQNFVIPNSVIEVSEGVYVENTNIPISGGNQSFWTSTYNNIKENYVKDATAIKVRELSVNYELPKSILSKTPLKKVVIGFIARNPWTWLPEENRFGDPEFKNQVSRGGGGVSANAIGIGGYMQAPPTKSYGFSLNIEF